MDSTRHKDVKTWTSKFSAKSSSIAQGHLYIRLIDFKAILLSTVSIISTGPEPENISTVDCMKYLTKVKDYLQIRGEMRKNVTVSFSEVEKHLKTKVEEKNKVI